MFNYNLISYIFQWIANIDFVGIASILGFLLSLYVAKNVYDVNKYLFIVKRLPQYLKNFEAYASTIIKLLDNFEKNKEEIGDEITKCYSDTKNIKKKIPSDLKNEIKVLRTKIKKTKNGKELSIDDSRMIYRQILAVNQSIQNFQKDYQIMR